MSDSQRVAIITGASQGIGESLMTAYRKLGYAVVGNSRSIGESDDPMVVTVPGDIAQPILRERGAGPDLDPPAAHLPDGREAVLVGPIVADEQRQPVAKWRLRHVFLDGGALVAARRSDLHHRLAGLQPPRRVARLGDVGAHHPMHVRRKPRRNSYSVIPSGRSSGAVNRMRAGIASSISASNEEAPTTFSIASRSSASGPMWRD